jgi:hypothetical protein
MVTFTYPHTGGSGASVVTFPNPQFGDSEDVNTQVIAQRSRNGSLYTFARDPSYQNLQLLFENLTVDQKSDFKTFMDTSKGLRIKYTDHESVDWVGVIITDPLKFENMGRNHTCNEDIFSLSLEIAIA